MNPIIRVSDLGKQYRIAASRASYETFREAISNAIRAPLRFFGKMKGTPHETIWALNDVSFQVMPGEVIGIIGRNGAGKSTLLKILSRITEPTRGEVELHGTVGSLLEVGTGFHFELTGRENIYLNGAILGMKKAEIEKRFDEIVAFAEVEKFIDTPVKYYSTGMHLRLGFAVAAHLEPDILLVDEVLAVGDSQFQKKCLQRMSRVGSEGRTIFFVSHQMSAVKNLCSRTILFDKGKLIRDGKPGDVVHEYLTGGGSELLAERVWGNADTRPGDDQFRLAAMRVVDSSSEPNNMFYSSEPVFVEIDFDLSFVHSALAIGFELIHRDGVVVFRSHQYDRGEQEWPKLHIGRNRLRCEIPPGLLNYGTYLVSPKVGLHGMTWIINGDAEIGFEVQLDHSSSPFWHGDRATAFPGVIAPCLVWKSLPAPAEAEIASSQGSDVSRT